MTEPATGTIPAYRTTAEVATEWQVSERTVYRWIKEGAFTAGLDYFRATPKGTGAYLWTDRARPVWKAGEAK